MRDPDAGWRWILAVVLLAFCGGAAALTFAHSEAVVAAAAILGS